MSAWLLAALLCARASAAVVETGGEASAVAPVPGSVGAGLGAGAGLSPIQAVPGAQILAPSLNVGAVIKAFPEQDAAGLPARAARLSPAQAPVPALPDSAAAPSATARRETLPPASPAGLPAPRRETAARTIPAADEAAGPGAAESLSALWRKIFDRAADRTPLSGVSPAGIPDAPSLAAGTPSGRSGAFAALPPAGGDDGRETLRDAVASPIPSAAAPGAALSFFRVPVPPAASALMPALSAVPTAPSAPITFERLSLELGSGLVVKVRGVLGLRPSTAASAPGGSAGAFAPNRPRAPITSTEWLERRGLLETLSASEAAASQQAASLSEAVPAPANAPGATRLSVPVPARAPSPASSPAVHWAAPDPAAPVRSRAFSWWALAFLPAAFVLFKKLH